MDQETDTDQFHDNEAGDIYDLYNACNGVLHNGLLDVRKLDELSQEELEALDVAWLRKIWLHTASGCTECQGIIRILNSARVTLPERADEPSEEPAQEATQEPASAVDASFV